jgi:hypothetical protein
MATWRRFAHRVGIVDIQSKCSIATWNKAAGLANGKDNLDDESRLCSDEIELDSFPEMGQSAWKGYFGMDRLESFYPQARADEG